MKNENYPVLIYREKAFEEATRTGIEQTHEALKKLIDIWNGLDVGVCTNLFALVNNASDYYTKAFQLQQGAEVPAMIGKYQISKDAFLNIVTMPVPDILYRAAKTVKKTPCFGYQQIWSIEDGQLVKDEIQAEAVINSRNIYAFNEHQEQLGRAVIKYVELSNYLDQQFSEAIQWKYIPAPPFSLVGKHFPNIAMLSLEVEQLRLIMSNISE